MARAAENPLVSCLCVTEDRPAFMPWLLWSYDRQSWPRRELVIVDSSAEPAAFPGREDVRVVAAPHGTGVAQKRNQALEEARGEIVSWFDDDDWQHPEKLSWLAEALAGGAVWAGARHGWFVGLAERRCERYRSARREVVFNSAGFVREAVLPVEFPARVRRASDTRWLRQVYQRHRGRGAVVDRPLFFWLCHRRNLSNPARRRRLGVSLSELADEVGPEAWDGTEEALDALEERLRAAGDGAARRTSPKPRRARTGGRKPEPAEGRQPETELGKQPPVSAMIKATVLDAPYLEVMARHMLAQARFPFAERVLVIDRPASFAGKYRSRPRADEAELDRIVERLRTDGVIDRTLEVDTEAGRVRAVLERYFGGEASRVPTHAATGGPIYPTLFGLESMASDHVLQYDADVFFHAGEGSWVSRALEVMARDRDLWLMMTHPGPPAGPPGSSLGRRNARIAEWDPELEVWRFRTATTRYFLCDRRRLHGRLQLHPRSGRTAPLEVLIGHALRRHGAFRGALGGLESWHLHAWHHGDPFPQWAAALAELIATGRYPDLQRGEYDLRLDRLGHRRAWAGLLPRAGAGAAPERGPAPEADPAPAEARAAAPVAPPAAPRTARSAELAVVLPVRDRAGAPVKNALASLGWQTAGRPAQVVVVSLGSRPEVDRELEEICSGCGATLIRAGQPADPWNKPLALNAGIRATAPEIPYLMTMDADIVLAPDFLSVALERLRREPPALVLCRSLDLPRSARLPDDPRRLLAAFDRLRGLARPRHRSGTGAIQAARRQLFFDLRGYDEDLVWWGAMDGDLVKRAGAAGHEIEWIDGRTALLHQWHRRKHAVLKRREEVAAARRAWAENHRLVKARAGVLERNPEGWGQAQKQA